MIIRRKPVGNDNLRKPQSLGMALLRNGIARVQALTVRRVQQPADPLDWGDGIPDDVYDQSFDDTGADPYAADMTNFDGFNSAISGAEASNRAASDAPRSVRPARSQAQRRSVQRRAASNDNAPATGSRRPAISDSDTMPNDLSFIVKKHRELGHLENQSVSPFQLPSQTSSQNATSSDSAASQMTIQRSATSDAPDESPSPRVRRRGTIVDVTPPRKGLPLGDEGPDPADELTPYLTHPATPVPAAPIQRTSQPAEFVDQATSAESASAAVDMGATLGDLDTNAIRSAIESMNAPSAAQSADTVNAPVNADRAAAPVRRTPDTNAATHIESSPNYSDYDAPVQRSTVQRSAVPTDGSYITPESTPSFDVGDYDEPPDDEPDPASSASSTDNTSADSTFTGFDTGLQAAIARAESPSSPDVPDAPNVTRTDRASSGTVQTRRDPEASNTANPITANNVPDARRTDRPTAGTVQTRRDPEASNTANPVTPNNVPDARQNAIQQAITRAESPAAPDMPSDAANTPNAPRTDRPTAGTVQTRRDPEASNAANPVTANNPPDARQNAIQRAITRAESPTTPDMPSDAANTPNASRTDRPNAGIVQTRRDPEASNAANPVTANTPPDARQDAIQRAITRAESPAAPDMPSDSANTPNAPRTDRPTAGTVQTRRDPEASNAANPVTTNNPPDARQNAIQQAITRAESPATPDMPSDAANTPNASRTDRPTAGTVQTRRDPEASNAANPVTANNPPDARQNAIQQAIARAESPAAPEDTSYAANTPNVTRTDRPSAGTVQTRRDPEASNTANPVTANNSPDARQNAIQQAITRAESPAAPQDVSYAANNTPNPPNAPRTDRPSAGTVQTRRDPEASNAANPVTANNPPDVRQNAIQRAIARAESPTAPQDASYAANTPNAPRTDRPSAGTVQTRRDPEASNTANPVTANNPPDARQNAIQQAITRAESPAMPDMPSDAANTPTPSNATRTDRPAAGTVQTQRDPEASNAANPVTANNTQDARQNAIQRAIARAESPAAPDDVSYAANTPTPSSATRADRPSAGTVQTQRDPEVESAPTFEPPYAPDDPHRSAFEQAIARAEGRAESAPAQPGSRRGAASAAGSNSVQRVPSLEEDAANDADITQQPVDLYTALTAAEQSTTPDNSARGVMRSNPRQITPANSAQPQNMRNVQRRPADDSSRATSTEADLLSMLGMPADTPIRRSNNPTPNSAASATAGSASASSARVQREIDSSSAAPSTVNQSSASFSGGATNDQPPPTPPQKHEEDPAEVEKMAQAVYTILRQRLKIERERSQGKVR